jgi:RNA polymerase sigma-70 factor (ECF subfamily)
MEHQTRKAIRKAIGSKMIGTGEPTDESLLRRMRAGDEEAFSLLYRRCEGPIYRFALHMSGSPWIAEDVTQEVFLALIERRDHFDPTRGPLRAYLFGIGRNLVLRRLDKDQVYLTLPEEDAAGRKNGHAARPVLPPADASRSEMIDRVRQATLTLPANYREVVVLCDLAEMSYEEAAFAVGCAVGTVRSRLHRARALLTDKLRERAKPAPRLVAGAQPKLARNTS